MALWLLPALQAGGKRPVGPMATAPVAPIKPTATLPAMVDILADIIIPITISGAFFALQLLLGKKGMLIGWSHLSM